MQVRRDRKGHLHVAAFRDDENGDNNITCPGVRGHWLMRRNLVTTSMPIHERIANADLPFSQKTHTLLLESVDQLAQQWINEIATVRSNTLEVENLLLAQLAKVKDHLTRLHLLGAMAAKEAERGRDN